MIFYKQIPIMSSYQANKMLRHSVYIWILLINLILIAKNQTVIILQTNNSYAPNVKPTTLSSDNITMFNTSAQNNINQSFIYKDTLYYCSLNPLMYTYIMPYNNQSYMDSTYQVNITLQVNNSNYNRTISSLFYNTFNNTNIIVNGQPAQGPISCQVDKSPTFSCVYDLQNICKTDQNRFSLDYFDIVNINVSGLENFGYVSSTQNNYVIISYWVLCKRGSSLQYGLLIEIVFISFALPIISIYSNAWSIGGRGINLKWWVVLIFNSVLVLGGVLAITLEQSIPIIVKGILVLGWIFSLPSVWLCANQTLFLFKKNKILRRQILNSKLVNIQVMEVVSLIISVVVCFAWFFSKGLTFKFNWIPNDIINVCMIVAGVKFLKFTSLRQSVVCFCITITVELGFVVASILYNNSYNTTILNFSNNPFQFQMPNIKYIYNQKCSWLPITALIFPGALMSYMRRFDSSRNTRVYLTINIITFSIGSVLWLLATIGSTQTLPYGLIAEPATILLVCFFAWRRKQIKTIWNGQFYDQQFAHKQELRTISLSVQKQINNNQSLNSPGLFEGLYLEYRNTTIPQQIASRNFGRINQELSDRNHPANNQPRFRTSIINHEIQLEEIKFQKAKKFEGT